MHALIIAQPHIERILAGEKHWEMRSINTAKRGRVGLIEKGTKRVVGVVTLTDSLGPLTPEELLANRAQHRLSEETLADPKAAKWNRAWVLEDAKRLAKPVPYDHPSGAVIWVALSPGVTDEIQVSLADLD